MTPTVPRCWKDIADDGEACTCPDCWPLPLVRRIGDLTARHFGRTIRIPDLHQPGEDWDGPKVVVTGKLDGLASVPYGRGEVWVRLAPKTASLDRPLPLTWPCELVSGPQVEPSEEGE